MPSRHRKSTLNKIIQLKNEKTSKHNVELTKHSESDWWKEFGISKKDIELLPPKKHCVFCGLYQNSEERFGELLHHFSTGLTMHYFCLLLSSGLHQTITDGSADSSNTKDSVYGFLIKDIIQEVKRAAKLRCTFCFKKGASIGCVVIRCKTKFHFPCGLEAATLSQFYGSFPSYCRHHRPTQDLEGELVLLLNVHNGWLNMCFVVLKSAEASLQCPICLCKIQSRTEDHQLLRPNCCSNSVFHRTCVQQQAFSCGAHFFRCPVCNDREEFTREMQRMGVYVPERDASWELTHDAFNDLLQRHSTCDAKHCRCPHGKDYDLKGTKWAVVLCDLCGSSGTHIACCDEVDSEQSYFSCDECQSIHGKDGARGLAVEMGVISPQRPQETKVLRRSARRRASSSSRTVENKRFRGASTSCELKESIV